MIKYSFFGIVLLQLSLLQASESDKVIAETVVVSATKTAVEIREVVEKVVVVSTDDIERSGASTTEELIQTIPGVSISNNPQAQIRINGLAGTYTKVLIDGVPVHGDVGGAFPIENIPMNDIDRIEIVKGAAGAIYGSDAIGGVVNFITKKKSRKTAVTGGYRYLTNSISSFYKIPGHEDDSFVVSTSNRSSWGGAHGADLGVRHTLGIVDLKVSAGLYIDGGVVDTIEKRPVTLFGDRPYWTMNELKRYNGSVYTGFDLSEDLSLSVDGRYSYSEDSRSISDDLKQSFVDHSFTGTVRGEYFFSDVASIGGYLSGQKFDHTYINYDFNSKDTVKNNRAIYNTFDSEIRYDVQLNSANQLVTGVNLLHGSVDGAAIKDGRQDGYEIAGFVQETFNLRDADNFILTTGLRGTYNSRFSGALSPKIGVRYNFSDPLFIRLAFGTGFKTPSFKQNYYDSFIHPKPHDFLLSGSIDLSPEKSRSINGSIGGASKLFTYELYSHFASLDDKITTAISSENGGELDDGRKYSYQRGYVNVAESRSYGADVSLSFVGFEELKVDGSFSYLYMEDRDSPGEAYVESELYSPYSFKITKTVNLRKYNIRIPIWSSMINYEGKQLWNRDAEDGDKKYLDRYHTVNSSLKQKFGEHVSLSIGINNLFDNHGEDIGFGYGRLGYANLRFGF